MYVQRACLGQLTPTSYLGLSDVFKFLWNFFFQYYEQSMNLINQGFTLHLDGFVVFTNAWNWKWNIHCSRELYEVLAEALIYDSNRFKKNRKLYVLWKIQPFLENSTKVFFLWIAYLNLALLYEPNDIVFFIHAAGRTKYLRGPDAFRGPYVGQLCSKCSSFWTILLLR